MNYEEAYREIIIRVMLNLQEGELLSINTNPSHLDFARDLAQEASEITLQPVHIVVINQGVPGDVISTKPILHDQLTSDPIRSVLLRIDDTEERNWQITAQDHEVLQQPVKLQQFGILAPPQLDKPIAPWAVAAVPGPIWARQLLGNAATPSDVYQKLIRVLKLDALHPIQAWKDQISLIDTRLAQLNRLDCEYLELTTGCGTSLRVSLVPESRWRGSVRKLDSGRSFMPLLPLDRMSMLPERYVTSGVVTSSEPFSLLGHTIRGAVLTFVQGEIVAIHADEGEKILATALEADAGILRLGELSLVDEHNALSEISHYFGYRGFDENRTSSITLGMGEAMHLEALDTYTDEEQLQEQTGCNVSNLRIRIPIGEDTLSVVAYTATGDAVTIMENGSFLL
jgi:aminopeptidase